MSPASVPPAAGAMTPAQPPPVVVQGMKSPMYHQPPTQQQQMPQTNDLRKIRRPSKPRGEAPSPPLQQQAEQQVKAEVKPDPEPKLEPEPLVKQEEEPVVVKEEPKFEARWDELPEKALHRIFWHCVRNESSNGFLTKAQQLSTAWRDASMDPSLWTHLDLFSLKEKHRNDKKVELLLKKYPQVTELKLNGWKNAVGTSTLKIVASNCPGLTSLGLSGCFKLSNEDMKLIGDSFEKLKRIDLSNVSV